MAMTRTDALRARMRKTHAESLSVRPETWVGQPVPSLAEDRARQREREREQIALNRLKLLAARMGVPAALYERAQWQ